ncbi:MAG: GGDEF domain-containing protein [Desulfovibrionaceae bacterium]|nr:GGDEF domain-containing protein [Desulfovibrionaceae bacterium]MBF0513421.1 GGDEF domain-containing protein [Desulfovibrionaceae bacterium]
MSARGRAAGENREAAEVYAFFERYGLDGNPPWMALVLFIRDLLPRLTLLPGPEVAQIQGLVLAALEKRDFSDAALASVVTALAERFRAVMAGHLAAVENKLELERDFSVSLLGAIEEIAPELRSAAAKQEANLVGLDTNARAAVLAGLDKQSLAARLKDLIGTALESAKEESSKLEKKVRSLEQRAKVDPLLTGLNNRRSFDEHIAEAVDRHSKAASPLALLMIDVDRFKAINDTHGHQAGDDVLKVIAKIVQDKAKETGAFAARYGGEELVVLIPGAEAAAETAQALRRAVENYEFLVRQDEGPGQLIRFTVSIGVADLAGNRQTAADLIRDADKAMYMAKNAGRNRVVRYKD